MGLTTSTSSGSWNCACTTGGLGAARILVCPVALDTFSFSTSELSLNSATANDEACWAHPEQFVSPLSPFSRQDLCCRHQSTGPSTPCHCGVCSSDSHRKSGSGLSKSPSLGTNELFLICSTERYAELKGNTKICRLFHRRDFPDMLYWEMWLCPMKMQGE